VGGTGEQRPLGLEGSPIEAPNGAIVLADDTGRVQSIAPDGSVNWATSISDDDRGSHGTPAIADGSLYVGTYDGVVSAVALDDGGSCGRPTPATRPPPARPTSTGSSTSPSSTRPRAGASSRWTRKAADRVARRAAHQPPALDGRDRPGARPPHLRLQRRPLLRVVVPRVGAQVGLRHRRRREAPLAISEGSRSSPRGREPSRDSTSRTDPSCGSSRPTAGRRRGAIRPRGHGRRHVRPGGARRRGVRRQPRQQRLRDRPPDRRSCGRPRRAAGSPEARSPRTTTCSSARTTRSCTRSTATTGRSPGPPRDAAT